MNLLLLLLLTVVDIGDRVSVHVHHVTGAHVGRLCLQHRLTERHIGHVLSQLLHILLLLLLLKLLVVLHYLGRYHLRQHLRWRLLHLRVVGVCLHVHRWWSAPVLLLLLLLLWIDQSVDMVIVWLHLVVHATIGIAIPAILLLLSANLAVLLRRTDVTVHWLLAVLLGRRLLLN